ncbi:hypothetical protein D3C73_1514170 [compost metagenome]
MSTSDISSLLSSFSISTRISMRSPRDPRPVRYSVASVTANSGAGRICSVVSDSTSDTPSTTIPTTRWPKFSTITTVFSS